MVLFSFVCFTTTFFSLVVLPLVDPHNLSPSASISDSEKDSISFKLEQTLTARLNLDKRVEKNGNKFNQLHRQNSLHAFYHKINNAENVDNHVLGQLRKKFVLNQSNVTNVAPSRRNVKQMEANGKHKTFTVETRVTNGRKLSKRKINRYLMGSSSDIKKLEERIKRGSKNLRATLESFSSLLSPLAPTSYLYINISSTPSNISSTASLSHLNNKKSKFKQSSDSNSISSDLQESNSSIGNSTSTEIAPPRVNVVDENPSLDVGPLMLLAVANGSTGRLPCSQEPLTKEDSVRLILWYRNDTSRPLLSYDAREEQKPRKADIFARSKEAFQRRDFILFYRSRWLESEPRISLGRGGESLILLNVRDIDQAEYRCTVHYKELPSVTYRLQLLVTDAISNVNIYDLAGLPLPNIYGPFTEGTKVSFLCKASCMTTFKTLSWLLEGESVESSWQKVSNDTAQSKLHLTLKTAHAHSALTCRSTCEHIRWNGAVRTSIVDKSVIIDMLYVPQARLFIDAVKSKEALKRSEGAQGGNIQVLERRSLTFVCLVRSNPKSYNITWLVNGHVFDIRGLHWTVVNNTLTMSKIARQNSGLYTCVASNSEGDGQSNAIGIKVAYPPYCKGPNNKHFTISRNSSIVLQCNVAAFPNNVTFSWRRTSSHHLPSDRFYPNVFSHDSMSDINLQNGMTNLGEHPELIELGPDDADKPRNYPSPQGPPLPHYEDPKMPTRSLLTLVPDGNHIGIVCLSRNEIGHTRDPCFYRISVIDSPDPPIGCHVNSVGSSSLKVDCKLKASRAEITPSQQTPGLSPVRSPGINGASILEVWAVGTLVANQTSDRGHWYINQLPSDTDLRLRIYSLSAHVPSEPVVLYAKTLPKDLGLSKASRPNNAQPTEYVDHFPDEENHSHLFILIGGIVLGLSFLLLVILTTILITRIYHKRRRRSTGENYESEDRECSVVEGDPWAMQSYPESYETIATSPL